jgi:hypothetical protein
MHKGSVRAIIDANRFNWALRADMFLLRIH